MPAGRWRAAVSALRLGGWWHSKLPPLLALAYLFLLAAGPAPAAGLRAIAALLASVSFLAIYGYLLNDLCDRDQDRRAGREHAGQGVSPHARAFACALLAPAAFLPWLAVGLGPVTAFLVAAVLLVATAYSAPPVRLKERGILGLLADAAGVHALPALLAAAAIRELAPGDVSLRRLVALATAWSLAYGVRGILIHQLGDLERDRAAGVETFAAVRGTDRARRLARRLVFPAEILAFTGLAVAAYPVTPVPAWLAAAYALFDAVRLRWVWRQPYDAAPLRPGSYIPPSDLYEVWLPVALAAALAVRQPLYLALLAAHVVLFRRELRARGREVWKVLRADWGS